MLRVAAAGLLLGALPLPLPAQAARQAEAGPAADWALRTLDGARVELAAFRGRPVVINVWATWCRPCVAELRSFQALHDSLAAEGVGFVFVTPERAGTVRRFLARHRYRLPVYLEAERMPAAFGLRALPSTFVLDAAGRVVLTRRGAAEWDDPRVRAYLRALLPADAGRGRSRSTGAVEIRP